VHAAGSSTECQGERPTNATVIARIAESSSGSSPSAAERPWPQATCRSRLSLPAVPEAAGRHAAFQISPGARLITSRSRKSRAPSACCRFAGRRLNRAGAIHPDPPGRRPAIPERTAGHQQEAEPAMHPTSRTNTQSHKFLAFHGNPAWPIAAAKPGVHQAPRNRGGGLGAGAGRSRLEPPCLKPRRPPSRAGFSAQRHPGSQAGSKSTDSPRHAFIERTRVGSGGGSAPISIWRSCDDQQRLAGVCQRSHARVGGHEHSGGHRHQRSDVAPERPPCVAAD
jgi:hypothetical protein